jgi:hypothetical protein
VPIHETSQVSAKNKTPVEEGEEAEGPNEFAYESDLRDFLAKNLSILQRGMRLYEEEGITGIEFPVGGRFIDILKLHLPRPQYGDKGKWEEDRPQQVTDYVLTPEAMVELRTALVKRHDFSAHNRVARKC